MSISTTFGTLVGCFGIALAGARYAEQQMRTLDSEKD